MNANESKTYKIRISFELFDSEGRYAGIKESINYTFHVPNDIDANKIKAHCWHACGLAAHRVIESEGK